jgi:hypothetical protein
MITAFTQLAARSGPNTNLSVLVTGQASDALESKKVILE